jgi:ribosomal protein S18 acetylase RimI-like enzyme
LTPGGLHIRGATAADAQAIARFHVASWRAAYRDLAPPAVIEVLDEARRLTMWAKLLAPDAPASSRFLVAEIEGRLVGVGGAGITQHPAYGGRAQISFLYIEPEHQRAGIGRRLMHELTLWLIEQGHRGVALGVVDGNAPAIRFYESLGGRRISN